MKTQNKFTIKKSATEYEIMKLTLSEYDWLKVIEDDEGRIKISWLEQRWRTVSDTQKMLNEIVNLLADFRNKDL